MLAILAPFSQHDAVALVIVCFVMALAMYIAPSCGHPQCAEQHRIQSVKDRVAALERNHFTFHVSDPNPACSLCKRHED